MFTKSIYKAKLGWFLVIFALNGAIIWLLRHKNISIIVIMSDYNTKHPQNGIIRKKLSYFPLCLQKNHPREPSYDACDKRLTPTAESPACVSWSTSQCAADDRLYTRAFYAPSQYTVRFAQYKQGIRLLKYIIESFT